MSATTPLLILNRSCDKALAWLDQQLTIAGLRAMHTFDLQDARLAHADCPCPHHGMARCDCQMVVVLVYGDHQPISLVTHSHVGRTWLYLVDNPQQRADPALEAAIRKALADSPALAPLSHRV